MPDLSKTQVAGLIVAGAAAGALATLLLAPKSGAQLRKEIRRLSKRTINQLDDLQCDIRGQISERYGKVKRMITA